jgi:NAD(P)H dehydrogenase (quinone)
VAAVVLTIAGVTHTVFYSTYSHIYKLAQAIAEGAGSVEGVTVKLARFPETLSDEVLTKMHALEAKVRALACTSLQA